MKMRWQHKGGDGVRLPSIVSGKQFCKQCSASGWFVKNIYSAKKTNFEIAISKTDVKWELIDRKGSNIEELFDIIKR